MIIENAVDWFEVYMGYSRIPARITRMRAKQGGLIIEAESDVPGSTTISHVLVRSGEWSLVLNTPSAVFNRPGLFTATITLDFLS